ncbi:MAG: hypothetical protein ABSD20_02875 [Terriglobales bacterium]
MAAACLEMLAGATILIAPDMVSLLLLGTKPEGAGLTLARFAAIALFALGIACLPPKNSAARHSAVRGLFVFYLGVAALLGGVGIATTLHGVLLWPAVTLHAVIAAALLPQLLANPSSAP